MIPSDWRPYHRESDGELVGYLVADGTDASLTVPTSLIGTPLGPPQAVEAAQSVLRVRGLAALAERWWCLLPRTLPTTPIAADAPDPDWVWRSVVLVEVDPARSRIRIAMAAPEELAVLVTLPTPVGGLLRSRAPE